MDTTVEMNSTARPKSAVDRLPELSKLWAEELMMTDKKRKQCNSATARRTHEKLKPMSMAEMHAEFEAVQASMKRPRNQAMNQHSMSNAKRWNASVKVDKKVIRHTAGPAGQEKVNTVRKVLCFQNNPQPPKNPRATMMENETTKFTKPEARAKKSISYLRARDTVRISGVFNMPPTPVERPAARARAAAGKENAPRAPARPAARPPRPLHPLHPPLGRTAAPEPNRPARKSSAATAAAPDAPALNDSWKSSCDASFLQREREIEDQEQGDAAARRPEPAGARGDPLSVSTPFKDYRSVNEYFNASSDMEKSANDNTIMCFERTAVEETRREESVIVSLCDMFTKATVTNEQKPPPQKTELEILLEIRKETEKNIKSQVKLLKCVDKLIEKKRSGSKSPIFVSRSLRSIPEAIALQKSPVLRCSVIKSPARSPSYVIPRKSSCVRKKVFHKSMPDLGAVTPKTEGKTRALNMYMEMKEEMNFLTTPVVRRRPPAAADTPAVTSHNLQQQLDKLFNNS